MEHQGTVLFVLILLSLSSIVISDSDCTYTILVKTGTVPNAGTDAKISLMLFDSKGYYIDILNLETWGDMPPGHDYFENGNLDVFEKDHKCLPGPICMIQLISDNTGNKPGWFVDYVEVIATAPSSSGDEKFLLNRWLALDEEPHTLQALVDHCKRSGNDHVLRHQDWRSVFEASPLDGGNTVLESSVIKMGYKKNRGGTLFYGQNLTTVLYYRTR